MEEDTYEPDWDIYNCTIESKPAIIGLDLELRRFAPLQDKKNVLEITIKLLSDREDGFPEENEWEALGQIEDELEEIIESKLSALFVGKTLCNGFRKLYYYAESTLLHDKYISEVMVKFTNYDYEYHVWEDEDWEFYFEFLFPCPEDYQKITNVKVLRNLEENGDQPEIPRQIDHWIYFKEEANRELYWEKIKGRGFKIEELSFDDELEENKFKLHISHTDKADEETINNIVIDLWQLAQEYEGDYDGWETFIMRKE